MADSASQPTANWADTAAALLSKLSGSLEVNLAFDQMEVQVPNSQNPTAAPATWRLNGSLRVRTKGENPVPGLSVSATSPRDLG